MGYFDDEYGIALVDDPTELHRGPMSRQDAEQWLDDLESNERLRNLFVIVTREVGPWVLPDA